jgi:hypothetical protein
MKTPRLLAAALVAALTLSAVSCSDISPVAPTAPTAQPDASLLGWLLQPTGLLGCTPQPYDSVTKVIGSSGGVINVGANRFYVPAGALSQDISITAVAPSQTVNEVKFQPQGLHFQKPAYLTMSYANCGLVGWLLPRHIAYTDDNLNILELLPALPNLLRQTATSQIEHFSGYVLAY